VLAGIQNAAAGLRTSDFQMDVLGNRLSSDLALPFPQAMDAASSPASQPLNLPPEGDKNRAALSQGQGDPTSTLPGLLPADTAAGLGASDPALDMGLYLVAKAAYQMNARVFSASAQELKRLSRLGE